MYIHRGGACGSRVEVRCGCSWSSIQVHPVYSLLAALVPNQYNSTNTDACVTARQRLRLQEGCATGQFTCCTSTKVRILTPEALRARAPGGAAPPSGAAGAAPSGESWRPAVAPQHLRASLASAGGQRDEAEEEEGEPKTLAHAEGQRERERKREKASKRPREGYTKDATGMALQESEAEVSETESTRVFKFQKRGTHRLCSCRSPACLICVQHSTAEQADVEAPDLTAGGPLTSCTATVRDREREKKESERERIKQQLQQTAARAAREAMQVHRQLCGCLIQVPCFTSARVHILTRGARGHAGAPASSSRTNRKRALSR